MDKQQQLIAAALHETYDRIAGVSTARDIWLQLAAHLIAQRTISAGEAIRETMNLALNQRATTAAEAIGAALMKEAGYPTREENLRDSSRQPHPDYQSEEESSKSNSINKNASENAKSSQKMKSKSRKTSGT